MKRRNENLRSVVEGVSGIIGVLAITTGMSYGCAKATEARFDSDDAVRAAENEGWSEPKVTEINRIYPQLQGCGRDDSIGFEMEAVSPNGNVVDLVVCRGLLKGASVRQG